MNTTKKITQLALLGVVIFITGMFKIPAPILGAEFQLSAPIAVLICANFGFKNYIIAGLVASILNLMLGTGTVYSVIIQLVFRVVAGGVIMALGVNWLTLALSGPAGTFAARLAIAQVTGVSWQVLCMAAAPGMVFTAIVAMLFYKPAHKFLHTYFPENALSTR